MAAQCGYSLACPAVAASFELAVAVQNAGYDVAKLTDLDVFMKPSKQRGNFDIVFAPTLKIANVPNSSRRTLLTLAV